MGLAGRLGKSIMNAHKTGDLDAAVQKMEDDLGQEVTLLASDGTSFVVTRGLVEGAFEQKEDTELKTAIDSAVLGKIVDYVKFHDENAAKPIPKPLPTTDLNTLLCEWDATFVASIDQDTMFKVLLGASTLKITALHDLMCAMVASAMKGKTPEDISTKFNIRKDATTAEVAEVREQYKAIIEG